MYWIPKLHKNPYKARFIANSSSCTTTNLSKLLTSCLTAVKEHIIKYCNKVYENSGINLYWSIKNSSDVLKKLQNGNFQASTISTYDFSTLYTTLPHNLIKEKLVNLIQKTFAREGTSFLACNFDRAFFTNALVDNYTMWTCQEVCESLTLLIDSIFVRFGNEVFRQVIGIPMGTNCAPLLADLFLYSYESEFIQNLISQKKKNVALSFNHTYRYIDDVLSLSNLNFDKYVSLIYPEELEIKNSTESTHSSSYLDLEISID